MKRTGLAVVVALLPGLLLVGSVSSAAAANGVRPAVVLVGSLGQLPGTSALVVVQVGLPYGETKGGHSPAGYDYPAVAEQPVTSSSFQIAVPDSGILQRAANLGHGAVEFNVLAFSGRRWTSQMVPATLTHSATHGNLVAMAMAQSRVVALPRFRGFSIMRRTSWRAVANRWRSLTAARSSRADATVPFICSNSAYDNPVEDMTRIGEVHVGDDEGLKMRWNYYSSSNTDLSVGISTSSATGPWSFDGSFTTSNDMGSDGGYTAYRATTIYSDGDMWYQRYLWTGNTCGRFYTTQVTSAVGDSKEGVNSPAGNPYGKCGPNSADPYGWAVVPSDDGEFSQDRAVAWGYSGDATIWGFGFDGRTGFTSSIHHQYIYNEPGAGDIYVCGGGSGNMPDSKIIYSGSY